MTKKSILNGINWSANGGIMFWLLRRLVSSQLLPDVQRLIRLLMQYLGSRGEHNRDQAAFFFCTRGTSLVQKKKPNCCSSCLTQYSVSFFLTEIKSLNADHNCRRGSFIWTRFFIYTRNLRIYCDKHDIITVKLSFFFPLRWVVYFYCNLKIPVQFKSGSHINYICWKWRTFITKWLQHGHTWRKITYLQYNGWK